MGAVYAARHEDIERRVALKLLKPSLASERETVSRFFKEAKAANRIEHPGIVQVFDLVESPTWTYLVMELLAGESLREYLDRTGALDEEEAVAIALQVVSVLAAAHQGGIVHRDLKPENIFLETVDDGALRVRLLDFGIAKLSGLEQSSRLTETAAGIIVGTPAYMSPEQAAARAVDHRADIYSFGAVLFEMVTGRPPFVEKNVGEYLMAHLSAPAPSVRSVLPSTSALLDSILQRCLAKDVDDRPEDMAQLERWLRGELTPPTPPLPRLVKLFASLGVMVAVAGLAIGLARGDPDPSAPPPATLASPAVANELTPEAPAPPAEVELQLQTAGLEGAEVVDAATGELWGRTPLTRRVRFSDQRWTLKVNHDGYLPAEVEVDAARDAQIVLQLRKAPSPVAAPVKATPRRATKAQATKVKAAPTKPPAPAPKVTKPRPEDRSAVIDPFGGG
jgi:serine/threonine protein kinase